MATCRGDLMKKNIVKYIFWILAVSLLALMVVLSKDAGISCDEVLHYKHSVDVYDYFATKGADCDAVHTPDTHLQYYGQSYDNLVTVFSKWFHIDDVYTFRHVCSAFAGWLAILVTALFAIWISGYGTGITVLILFAISPTFMGHSLNNLKDIPFALSYIASLFLMAKIFVSEDGFRLRNLMLLAVAVAFSISIRAGGLLLICYLYLFLFVWFVVNFRKERSFFSTTAIKFFTLTFVSLAAFFMSILLWPYAQLNPFTNVYKSYKVMAAFPDTFRQLFEGVNEWSDFMPWYYLPKSMLITIPVVVTLGVLIFLLFTRRWIKEQKWIYVMLLFAVLFPMFFAIVNKSNLYSSWRQFLFLYPCIVLLAASGIMFFLKTVKYRYLQFFVLVILLLCSFYPLRFMISGHPYQYLYYNQWVGGVHGAYGKYELDYYYVSQTEASKWLIDYMERNNIDSATVKATYTVEWMFRNKPGIQTSYCRNEELCNCDWDYAIVTNRYINPEKLRNGKWPPSNTIHEIIVDGVTLCAVLERRDKSDYQGYKAVEEGRNSEAVNLLREAVENDSENEMIFYNFARALYNNGQKDKAVSVLKKCIEINSSFEPALMYLGNIAVFRGDRDEAVEYYSQLIQVNRKYFEAYVKLAGITDDKVKAVSLLKSCLKLNPHYVPAISALADVYRESDPEKAEKIDRLLENQNEKQY